jgi:fibronectin-binding autotransporter adhesin
MGSAHRSFVCCLAPLLVVVACGGGLVAPPRAAAAVIYKANNNDALNLTTSWWTTDTGTTNPASIGSTDTLWFGSGMGATRTLSLGGDLTTGALRLDNVSGTPNYSVTISAGNTLTLNANNDYTTGTPQGIVLNSGTGGSLTLSADVTLGNSQIWVNSRTLNVGGGIALGSNTLSFNTAGGTQTLSGVISGTGSLNKSGGPGTLALSNTANTFTGTVALVGGNTTIASLANGGTNSSLGAGTSSIVMNGATLIYVGTGAGSTNRAIDMRAGVAINNNAASGAIQFTAASVLQGGTASARTLTLGGTNTGDNTFGSVLGDSGTGANISRLQKSNAGRWIVTGANTYTGATVINQGTLRVSGTGVLGGAAGLTTDEGNLWFTSNNANAALEFETVANLGPASQIRFRNTSGTAGQGGALVYIGTTDQTLSKTLQCDTSVGMRLESNSVGGSLTFNGAFSQSNRPLSLGGTGTGGNTLATAFTGTGGLTKRDSGTWVLAGTHTFTGGTTVSGGSLVVNGSLTNTSGVSIASGATLGGSGAINAVLSGAGLVSPGNSPGITTATAVDPSGGLGYAFEFTATGSPSYGTASASVNDVLRLSSGSTPFAASLSGGNLVDVYFDVATLAAGDAFRGGFYTDRQADFLASVENGSYAYWVKGDGTGTARTFNGQGYFSLSNFDPGLSVTLATVAETAAFAGGSVDGQVTQFVVVPEPGMFGLAAAGLGWAGWAARRRRR